MLRRKIKQTKFYSILLFLADKTGLLNYYRNKFPKVLIVDDVPPYNCRFEVTNRSEVARVRGSNREVAYITKLISLLTEEDILFDIGACIGIVTIPVAKSTDCQVVSFEPDPIFRGRLLRNLQLNDLGAFEIINDKKNLLHPSPKEIKETLGFRVKKTHHQNSVQIVSWAVSNRKEETLLYTDGISENSPSLSKTQNQKNAIRIGVDSIDHALDCGEIQFPTAIKLDVEGAEGLVLEGMRKLLNSDKRPKLLFLELHPLFLKEFGFEESDIYQMLIMYETVYREQRGDQIHLILQSLSNKQLGR
jgi:FkbM family methyltransferase